MSKFDSLKNGGWKSILKNGRAKAVKIDTLNKICKALDCQPGDILEYRPDEEMQ